MFIHINLEIMGIDKFIGTEGSIYFPICNECKHFLGWGKCRAFPESIPDEILDGDNDHSSPLPGQENDLTFQPGRETGND